MPSFVTHLSCPTCGAIHDHRRPQNVCTCGSPLLVEYDLSGVGQAVHPGDLRARPTDMWRYSELLPVDEPGRVRSLGEGFTPLVRSPELARRLGVAELWVKDEGANPTGTFKARGAACGVARATELGIREVALPTAGNAGGAWACYGAAAGLHVHVAMPRDAPLINQLECRLFGADLVLVDGLISEAGEALADPNRERGWFDVATLHEPYRIEGKKTLGLEIAEQLEWSLPDAIVCPVGGGVGVIGLWRAFQQLAALGWLRSDPPRLVVTQAEGCAPIVKAFHEGRDASEPWPDPMTFAHGLRVPKAFGDFLVLRAVRETGGTAVAVSDQEIAAAMVRLASAGVSACPEGAAAMAAAVRLRESGDLGAGDRVVLVNTGSGYKDPGAMERALG